MTLKKVNYPPASRGQTSSTNGTGSIIDLNIKNGHSLSALFAGTFTLVASLRHGSYPHHKAEQTDEQKKQAQKDWRSTTYYSRKCVMQFDTEDAREAAKDALLKMEPTDIRNGMQDKNLHLKVQDAGVVNKAEINDDLDIDVDIEKEVPALPAPTDPV